MRISYSKKVLKNVHYFQFLPLSRFPGDTAFKSPNCKTVVICATVTTKQNKIIFSETAVKIPHYDFLKL